MNEKIKNATGKTNLLTENKISGELSADLPTGNSKIIKSPGNNNSDVNVLNYSDSVPGKLLPIKKMSTKINRDTMQKVFLLMDTIKNNLQSGKLDALQIARTHKVSIELVGKIKKFLERETTDRKLDMADNLEITAATILSAINPREIKKTKLHNKISSIDLLIKNMQLLRGDSTDNKRIDWSKMSPEQVINFVTRID